MRRLQRRYGGQVLAAIEVKLRPTANRTPRRLQQGEQGPGSLLYLPGAQFARRRSHESHLG